MKIFVVKRKWIAAMVCLMLCAIGLTYAGRSVSVSGGQAKEVPIYSVETEEAKIALTFDCAWNDNDIDSILDTLDKYQCKATFFLVGDWIERFPESVKKLYDRGHEIGNHSYNHGHYNSMSEQQIHADMDKCDKMIEEITGVKPTLFRAPYGEYNNTVIRACKSSGREYIQWNVDSLDWKDIPPADIFRRSTTKIKNGDILLLHNGTKYTAEALPDVLAELTKRFSLVKVSDLIYHDGYTIDAEGTQKREK
jgi:polysaccharide deacetylase family sporulation protein PdaB